MDCVNKNMVSYDCSLQQHHPRIAGKLDIHHLLKMNKYYNLISEFSFYLSHVTITTLVSS
ncbi:hypothetical protein T4E_5924 [Trichinella pseudospiralis]|uniref:Uncharacterized protein n=1 Tax=Trichinella pseudospiralis TaxID=6337 RepID=A0A0V0XWU6_TRIPS|nr:hypothetical protein T4E_5924 [Trichinella pseudospiralis]